VASDAEVYTGFNTPCEIILAASDADNDPFEITILQQPQHGTLSVTGESSSIIRTTTTTVLIQFFSRQKTGIQLEISDHKN
jgi:hypothetical protein